MQKAARVFIYSAGVFLLLTGIAKIVSATGTSHILEFPDPILEVPYRDLFWIVGLIELAVAATCFFSRHIERQAKIVAALATVIGFYRLALKWIHYDKPCSCLGTITGALHIPTEVADSVMKLILLFLIIGSYGILGWYWKAGQEIKRSSALMGATTQIPKAKI